jgi:protocatechuate 3,4-dioxygenase beta subunit
MRYFSLFQILWLASLSFIVMGCSSSGSGTIDSLLGNFSSAPILTSVPDQIVSQEDLLKIDVNNLKEKTPGDDKDMSYVCYYDNEVDGILASTKSCSDILNSTVTFDGVAGILSWTPHASSLGNYEVRITGKNSDGSYDEIFTVGVRLKFDGIGLFTQITGSSVTINWTPNTSAQGYQVFKLNPASGQYETLKSVSGGGSSGTTVTGLTPNSPYTLRVQAIDALGNFDGNVVSRSFTTTELVKLSMNSTASTLGAGSPTTITVTAYNANGTPQTIGGLPVVPAIASGTSSGTFSAVTDNNDGTYTFTFTPNIVGTAITIDVSINISFFLNNIISLNIIPGPASSANSSISISSNTVVSGNLVTATATVRDAFNNPINSGPVISFIKTGGTSTGNFSTITNQGNGVYSLSYTGITAGTAQTLQVKSDAVTLTPTTQIQVLPGTPVSVNSTLTISSATISSGTAATVTATLKDINNNPVPSGIMVVFNKSGGTSSGNFDSIVNAGAGVYTTTYSGVNAGTAQMLSVSVDGITLVPVVTVTVVPGPASLANSSLTIGSPTVVSGSFATVTATLKDVNSNPIESATVSFTKTGGTSTGTFNSVTNQGNGVYNIRYTGVIAGTAQTLAVLVNGTNLGASTSITVLTGTPSPTQSTIAISSGSVVSGQAVTVTATMKDENNNPVTSGVAISFSKTGGTSTGTFSAVTNQGAGVYTVTYTGVASGTAQTINVLTDGSALGPNTTVSVTNAPPLLANSTLTVGSASISSGQTTTVTATIKDLNNNPISSGVTVTFSKTGGTSTGTFSSVTNQGAGVYTITYSGLVSGTAQSLAVLINGTSLGLSTPITVLTGAPSLTQSSIAISSGTVASGQSVTVTATIKDENNNPVTSGVAIGFAKTGGTSTGTFGTVTHQGAGVYTVTYTGVVSGTAQTINVLTDSAALGPNTSITVLNAPPNLANSTLTIGAASITSGQTTTVTATIKDLNNNPISSGVVVSFTKTSGTSTGTFSTITNQGSGVYTVTYTGIVAGTAQDIKVLTDTVNLGLNVGVTVRAGSPSAAQSSISVASSSVTSGQSVTITGTVRDANNNPITSGVAITFSKTGGSSTGTFSAITNQGAGVYTLTYSGVVAGSAQTLGILTDGSDLGPTTPITVVPGAPASGLSTLSITANVVIAGQNVTLTASIKDANSNPISSGILVTFDKFGGTSFGNYSTVVNQGGGIYTTTYTGITAGTAQSVQANVNGAGFGPTQSIQVLVGAPSLANSSLTVSSGTVASGANISVTAVIKDSQNNPITSQYAITMDTIGGSSTGTLSVINNSGTGTFTATYLGSIAGSAQTLRVLADGTPISGLTTSVQVIPGPASAVTSTFTIASSNVQSSTATALAMNVRDANNNAISSGATVTFTKSTGTSDGTLSGVSNTGSGNYTATYTGTLMGAPQTINLVVNGTAVGLSVTVTVSAGPPTHFAVVIPAGPNPSIDCTGPYTLTMKDVNENTTSAVGAVTVTPSSAPVGSDVGTLFTDSSCSNGVAGFNIPAATSVLQFYYKNYIPNTFTLTLTPTGGISAANISINNYAVLSWMGASAYFTMNGTGSGTVMDDAGGGSWQPYDVTTSGNFLYAVDNTANRILRYNINTNTFAGWIGYIGSVEGITGADSDNTCASPTLGGLTSSWCLGGRANVTATNLFNGLRNIASDSTYIYISSYSNNRIIRIKQSDGSLQGWIGKINTTAATSPASCVSAGTSATAPTWCFGGTSAAGSADGQFNGPTSLAVYSGKLYVAEYSNHRIQKIDLASGAPEGWVGQAATTPPASGQLGTCSSLPAVGAKTPGWCLGGTSQVSKRNQGNLSTNPSEVAPPDEGFYNPMGVATDGTYLYVGDGNNYRIARLTLSTGAFAGWVGYVYRTTATSPTSPAQSSGNYTTTWTSGGVTEARSTNGFGQVNTVIADSGILYITDNQHRVIRIRSSDGLDLRWIGRAGTSPTGGYTGCSSTPVSGTNPGWCVNGGGGRYGNTSGTFYNPAGMAVTATKLYVTDSSNFRIQRFDLTNGSFDGWIGGGNVPAAKWSRGYVAGSAASRGGIDDYSFGDITGAFAGITMNSSHIFLSDVNWHRIKKYNRNEGSFVGYIGQIQSSGGFYPTGPDACVGYTSGMTPDWCTGGGRTTSGAGIHGYNNPYNVTADSTYVYITNYSNHRIDRVRSSDALYLGWLGQVSTTPTDGDPSCLNTNSPSPSPDWCIGGAASAGSTNGKFNAPRVVFYDSAQTVLYAIDNTSRIMKIDPTNGAFLAVTGGMTAGTGCTVTNNVAAGWCTDATGNSGTSRYGGLNAASAMATNTGYIFIADSSNNRIARFDKTSGAPAGFISKMTNATNINTTGTGGACSGVTTGYPRVTPGWCSTTTLGLTMNNVAGTEEGAFNTPRGIWADATYVYVADTLNNRLVRITAATGAFAGWKGLIVSTTGMTDPDCIAAGNGGITPKWCTGGTAGPGRQLGAFDYPSGLYGDSNYIYVYDGRNNRIVTIPK